MANTTPNANDEGIEIHWDEREGYLSLACGREDFDRFRQVVREELTELPDLPFDKVITIEISDIRKIVARQKYCDKRVMSAIVAICLLGAVAVILALWFGH